LGIGPLYEDRTTLRFAELMAAEYGVAPLGLREDDRLVAGAGS
jgi:hypothetical protein